MQQEKFNSELKISQKNIEILVQTVLESFNNKKFITLNNLRLSINYCTISKFFFTVLYTIVSL